MFFMMGITEGRKKLNFQQTVVCSQCGRYGRYMVYMTYTVLSLFFIPCLKWNKQYYVESSCCHTTYRLNPEVGKRIDRGEQPEIHPQDLEKVQVIHSSSPRPSLTVPVSVLLRTLPGFLQVHPFL